MDPQRVEMLVSRYRTLAAVGAIAAVIGWCVVAARLDGPRSLGTAWAVWLAIACVSTALSCTTAVLAALWQAVGRAEPRDDSDQWT